MLRPDIGRNYDYFSKVAIKRGNIWVTSLFFCVFCSMLTIYDTANEIRFQTPINKGSKRVVELMGSDYVLLKFSVSKPIYFQLGDWCDVPGFGRFELVELYNPTYNKSTGGYDYELELEAYYCKWRNKIFKYTPETGGREASWSLTATLDVHLGVFVRNLKALGYKYNEQEFIFSIDSTVTQSAKLLTYNNTDMITALNMMAEAWECEWWIEDHVIYFGRCEIGTPIDFEQGVNVADISSSGNKNVYATRIYAFGSTRNIPVNYRPVDETVVVNGIVQKRLMLPVGTPYVDAYPNMPTEAAVEQVVVFDDIYPRTDGTIDSVSTYTDTVTNDDGTTNTETFYRFKDNHIQFSQDYILENEELHIIFQSGKLNGLDFGVMFNPLGVSEKLSDGSWNPDAQLWEIVANEDYGRKLPDTVLLPQVGDKYVLYGWDATKIASLGLIEDAEQELLKRTEEYIAKTKVDPNSYPCTMMSDWMKEQGETPTGYYFPFGLGDCVNLISDAYFVNGSRQSRIVGYECQLDYPYDSPIITVGETLSTSRLGALEDTIESLTLKGQTFVGGGNGGGGSTVYLITTNDTTTPTNRNAFSSLRSLKEFLSKTKADRTPYPLNVGGKLTGEKGVQFGDSFADGLTGFGGMVDEDGNGWLESLSLRRFLEVPELRYNRVEIQIGNKWNAPGGGIVEQCIPDLDSDGNPLMTGTVILHLEDGEIGTVAIDDICMGIFHDGYTQSNNSTADYDDSIGNFHFAGFYTAYFRITDILETGRNSKFRYMLRAVSDRWKMKFHPCEAMHFVGYGNFTDTNRQTSRYSTRTYERYLKGVNDWEFTANNIGAQFGDLSNLSVFGLFMTGYSAYLNNIYMTGVIEQTQVLPIRMEITTNGDGFLAYGESMEVTCRVYQGWKEITDQITDWTITRDSGEAVNDAAWQLKQKVKDFDGTITLTYTDTDNDLGTNPNSISTLFTMVAKIDGDDVAQAQLIAAP